MNQNMNYKENGVSVSIIFHSVNRYNTNEYILRVELSMYLYQLLFSGCACPSDGERLQIKT